MKNNKLRLLVIVIVGLLMIGVLSCIVIISNNSKKIIAHRIDDTNINISLNNKYKHIDDNKCDFHYSNNKIDLYIMSYDTEGKYDYSPSYIIRYDDHIIKENVDSYKVIKDTEQSNFDGLIINTKVVSGVKDGVSNTYHISTVSFNDDDRYILNVIQISESKYYNQNSILFSNNINAISMK